MEKPERQMNMMRKILAACMAAVTMILMVSCGGEQFEPHVMTKEDIGAVRVSDGEKITYGMKRFDVEKILGKSDSDSTESTSISYDGGKISIFYRSTDDVGKTLTTDQQTVAGIQLGADSAGAYESPRGLQVGDTRDDILKAYGEYPGVNSEFSVTYQYDVSRGIMITPDRDDVDFSMGLKDQVMVQFVMEEEKASAVIMMDRQMSTNMN